jgi:hypothetical protein
MLGVHFRRSIKGICFMSMTEKQKKKKRAEYQRMYEHRKKTGEPMPRKIPPPEGFGNTTVLAKRLGINKTTLSLLIKKGVFEGTFTKTDGAYLFDIEAAVQKAKDSSDPRQRGFKNKVLNHTTESSPITDHEDTDTIIKHPKSDDFKVLSFNEARTIKEQYTAEMKKMDYEERAGNLLREEDVTKGAFEMYRQARDSLLNIVDRISSQLSVENDEFKIRLILETEIKNAINHIRVSLNEQWT